VALYKGLKVAVYTVDKPEISLTRQDLVELVNVRSSLLIYYLSYTVVANVKKELCFEGKFITFMKRYRLNECQFFKLFVL